MYESEIMMNAKHTCITNSAGVKRPGCCFTLFYLRLTNSDERILDSPDAADVVVEYESAIMKPLSYKKNKTKN